MATTPAAAAGINASVVLGHGVSNTFFSKASCARDSVCLDSWYVWKITVTQTVAGAAVPGIVSVLAEQHTEATTEFVRSVELFVLRPVTDAALSAASHSNFEVLAMSARDDHGRYCLPFTPSDVGLKLAPTEVDHSGDRYCFTAYFAAASPSDISDVDTDAITSVTAKFTRATPMSISAPSTDCSRTEEQRCTLEVDVLVPGFGNLAVSKIDGVWTFGRWQREVIAFTKCSNTLQRQKLAAEAGGTPIDQNELGKAYRRCFGPSGTVGGTRGQ